METNSLLPQKCTYRLLLLEKIDRLVTIDTNRLTGCQHMKKNRKFVTVDTG